MFITKELRHFNSLTGLARCHGGVHLVVYINPACLLFLVCSQCLLMCRVLHHKFSPIYVLLFKSWRYCDLTDIEVAVIWQTLKLLCSDRHWSCCDLTDIEVTVLWQTLKLLWSDRHWSYCALTDIDVTVLWQTLKLLCSERHWSYCALTDIAVAVIWHTLKLLYSDRHRSWLCFRVPLQKQNRRNGEEAPILPERLPPCQWTELMQGSQNQPKCNRSPLPSCGFTILFTSRFLVLYVLDMLIRYHRIVVALCATTS